MLARLAKQRGLVLRQRYARRQGLIAHQRHAHAKQWGRANRELRRLRTYLRRVCRDIARKIDGDEAPMAVLDNSSSTSRSLSFAPSIRADEPMLSDAP